MPGAFGSGHVCALFVEGRVHEVHVFLIQLVAGQAQPLAEALEVDHFPGPQEADGIIDIRVIGQAENVVVCRAGFLLCCDLVRTTFLLSELGRLSICLILCYNNIEFGSLSILNDDL